VLKLGKTTSALVAKLISSKMPARFNTDSIRQYLAEKWGLGPSRQTSVLLFALVSEPQSRIPSVKAAEQFLDDVLSKYAESCGITLQVRLQKADEKANVTQIVDSAVLAELSKCHRKMASGQFKALAEYLQFDLPNASVMSDSEALVAELQQKLDTWTAEFSEDFLSGIAPTFDAKKARRYNSWWNAARQEILGFYHGTIYDSLVHNNSALEIFINRLRNRADDRLATMARSLAQQAYFNHESAPGLDAISQRIELAIASAVKGPPRARPVLPANGPRTIITDDGSIKYTEVPRHGFSGPTAYAEFLSKNTLHGHQARSPFICLKSDHISDSRTETGLTATLLKRMSTALESGVSFENKNFLVTGAGQGSIGAEIVRLLLAGGACVIVTTSREPAATAKYFQQMYEDHGGKGSELRLMQCNQASAKDCERLIDYIYDVNGLGRDLDAILPFAAASEGGTEIEAVAAKSELVHRLMLINVFRLLGRIIKNKRDRAIDCHPTQVLLPLSPNHGTFGGDGLYPESKLGLESLFNRVKSESWSDELSICGVKIGWTRSTGLMTANDIVSEAMEKHGVLTFSAREMAFNIVMLLTQEFVDVCEDGPLEADFSGGLGALDDCHEILSKSRSEINLAAEIARAVKTENDHEKKFLKETSAAQNANPVKPRSILRVGFPRLPVYTQEIEPLNHLQGMKDLVSTVVVVGFSELGPWGSSRLRWEIESQGRLSQAGYVEMAWLMNLIQHFDGQRKDGYYVGWVDTKTGEPVCDADIEQKYGKHIAAHTGVRLIEPESAAGYDPRKKEFLQEIAIEEDLPEFEASLTTAEAFRLRHGKNVSIHRIEGTEICRVQVKRGASIMIAKAVPFTWGSVAGQLPTGWNPAKYGIPEDLIHQVDPVTLYTVCCVSEAFFSAGITDPLEVFKYIHLSEIGNFIGSSMGGALKTRNLYRDIYLDKEVQADVLQDTYLNTTAAWVNMLLLGSTGPIKTPVGACATGVESIDSGFESIMSGKTKMCIVGGYDDFQEEESFGFSKMKATVNVAEELARGRLPSEMSRPTAESRAGFVEAHGCGVQLLCRADLALEMGLPIYGVIAGSTMAADKIGRSVPAPGQGILTFAKETTEPGISPLLGLDYRRKQMQLYASPINSGSRASLWSSCDESSSLDSDYVVAATPPEVSLLTPPTPASRTRVSQRPGDMRARGSSYMISPLRAALAKWGLTIDDLDFASLHATSTKANDLNEPDVICKQMAHLGRTAGRPLWAICQKSVTGHPKAPAAAWMLNGCLQVLDSGLVPGNRNADNLDPALRESHHLCFPTRAVQTKGVKAFILTSFGFGQKSGQVVGVAPKYFFATLAQEEFDEYRRKVTRRKVLADRGYAKALMSNRIVSVQTQPPYEDADATRIFLDPLSRMSDDFATGSYRFDTNDIHNAAETQARLAALYKGVMPGAGPDAAHGLAEAAELSKIWIEERIRNGENHASTVGIDLVELSAFTAHDNAVFVERNYTEGERRFARHSLDSRAAFASRWCAKEAVFKCLRIQSKGAGAAMKDIEITSDSGIPKVLVSTYSQRTYLKMIR
jgi:fatty acid synthase subunit alpha